MNKMPRWALACALLPMMAACSNNPPPPAAEAAPPPPPALSDADQQFVKLAGASDAFEIQSSQAAADKAHRKAVKDFASQMVQAHTGTTQQLTQIVTSKGMPAPQPQLDDQQQQMLSALQGETGAKFERDYVKDQVMGHEMAVKVFQDEIQNGQDADVKAFAQQTLPTIQQHLTEAQALQGKGGKHMMRHHHKAASDAAM